MDESIISLCMVVTKNDGFKKQLFRMADVENQKLIPTRRDSDGIDRDILYYPSALGNLSDNHIALFSWTPFYDDGWKQTSRISNLSWIEVIEFQDATLTELIDQIKQGVNWVNTTHDFLVVYKEDVDTYTALYLPKKCIRVDKGVYTCSSNVKTLHIYQIPKSGVLKCANPQRPNDTRRYYENLILGEPFDTAWIYSINELISSLILKHIKGFSTLVKRERQAVRKVLTNIDSSTISMEIAKELGCNQEEAQKHLERYMNDAMASISVDDYDGGLFQVLIENDSALSKSMMASVEEAWKTQNKDLADESERLKQQIDNFTQQIALQKEEIAKNEQYIERLKALEADVTNNIRERLQQARYNMGSFLTEYSFLLPRELSHSTSLLTCEKNLYIPTIVTQEDGLIDEVENLEAAKYNLMTNLTESGVVDTTRSVQLAQYLTIAYHNRVNLLICGIGGVDIATGLSAALCSCNPAKLNMRSKMSQDEVQKEIEVSEAQIILVQNAFGSESFEVAINMIECFPERMFIFTTPFSQSLAIEPHDLYQYMLPLFTEFFVSGEATRDFVYSRATHALEGIAVSSREISKAKSELAVYDAVVYTDKCQKQILASIKANLQNAFKDVDADKVCFFAFWLPFAVCMGRNTELLDMLKDIPGLDADGINEIESYLERGI